jgi:hypothetical protein
MHIVAVHNIRTGGTGRNRLKHFTYSAINGLSKGRNFLYKWYLTILFWLKLFLFEKAFWLFKRIYGFLDLKFDS